MRLKSALDLLKQKTQEARECNNELVLSEDDNDNDIPIPKRNLSKQRKRVKTTKLINDVLDVAEKTKQRSKRKTKIDPPVLSDDE